jgi:hypothetical protein
MKRVNANTSTMKKIEIVRKAEVEVAVLDQVDPTVPRRENSRKVKEKARRVSESKPLLPRTEARLRVIFT